MATAFLAPPTGFVGRDDYLSRFRARLEHYNFFLYEGMPGVGKTALVRRLAKETRALGVRKSVFLQLVPGEGVTSILARLEAHCRGKSTASSLDRGDVFGRLIELLAAQKVVLVLDHMHNLRREEQPALVRALRGARGPFRVLATLRGDPELSAMDVMLLHQERVGALSADEVKKIAQGYKQSGDNLELLVADAARGGATAHPLTLRYMLALCGNDLPPKEFLDGQSARSINAFKALLTLIEERLPAGEREALTQLAALGQPIARVVATRVFGAAVNKLTARNLIDEIDGDLYVHSLVAQYFGNQETLPVKAAVAVSGHLKERALSKSEPLSLIRAGKLLAQAGRPDDAVSVLADGWEAVRDLGFLEAYLKILASIPAQGALGPRLALLSARARMRQGNPVMVRDEMERLGKERDAWTRERALAALIVVYDQAGEPKKVLATFSALRRLAPTPHLLLPAGSLAAQAMLRVGQAVEAEKLSRELLQKSKQAELDRQAELHRLLSQVYAQKGELASAVQQAQLAAKLFAQAGDLYHAANVWGFIGDLYREAGEFEQAQQAFQRFHQLAVRAGDRSLVQIAELAEAWVALDVGDITSAQKRVLAVEKELSPGASRRLRRYLATARALLEAGRGRHDAAADLLTRAVEAWQGTGQLGVTESLRAQLVRSLISTGQVDAASEIVADALARLDTKSAAPRVAAFLRESALIRLRRKEVKQAMSELAQACKLFAQGGNRREEALTLYRIAHAAFEEGDIELAKSRAAQALQLATKIKHTRAVALAREIHGRIALVQDNAKAAVQAAKEATQTLRRLGDEIGTLHCNESLMWAQLAAGDVSAALKLGPKLSEQAETMEVREVRLRAIALTGVALVRKGRIEAANRCFRELSDTVAPATAALMWRLGEALAAAAGEKEEAQTRRARWIGAIKRFPETSQARVVHRLEQLALPPRERCQLRTGQGTRTIGVEEVAWLQPADYQVFVDVMQGRIFVGGKPVSSLSPELYKLFVGLVVAMPDALSHKDACRTLFGEVPDKPEQKLKPLLRDLTRALRAAKGISIANNSGSLRLTLPKSHALVIPTQVAAGDLSGEQKRILKLVRRLGSAPLATIETQLKVPRPQLRREVGRLVAGGLLEPVREGRGQAYRLA